MPPKRSISAKDIVNDIRGGLADTELMEKYHLSSRGLQSLFRKFVEGKFVSRAELDVRTSLDQDTAEVTGVRRYRRRYPVLPATVHEPGNPETKGMLRDITERGVGITGIEASVDEIRTFVIRAGSLSGFEPFQLQAICRWAKKGDDGKHTAGFEITSISRENLQGLRDLIQGFTLAADTVALMRPDPQ